MHDLSCHCSAHEPNGAIDRTIRAALRANRDKLWAIRGSAARIRYAADQTALDRLAANSGMA